MSTVGRCFETRLFKNLSNHIFCSLLFRKYVTDEDHISFWKCSIVDVDLRHGAKKWEFFFCFLDNCTWIEWGNFFLLRREYLLSAVNAITNTPRISDTLRRTFSKTTFEKGMKQYDGSVEVQFFRLFNMFTLARYSKLGFLEV